ncbi:MAG: zf-HC2 domain-containing protein [Candidatus Hydrogenedentes bacterium]|nr:zf-HC2 domain-containing protein [Candidatus Hydrogenedentota bacterium]
MMYDDCDTSEHLVEYLDGSLTGADRDEVESHLAVCSDCRAELLELGAMLDVCRRALTHPAPRDRFKELKVRLGLGKRVLPEIAQIPVRHRGYRTALRRLSAAAIILVGFGLLHRVVIDLRPQMPPEIAAALNSRDVLEQSPLPFPWSLVQHGRRIEVALDQ